MSKTKTFDVNSARFSGRPAKYFDNDWNIKLGVVVNGNTVWIKVNKDNGKPPFTEEEFKRADSISFLDAKLNSWVSRQDKTNYEITGYGNKVLLGVDTKSNSAQVGGVVVGKDTETNRAKLEIPYMDKAKRIVKYRYVLVEFPKDYISTLSKGDEVVVQGTVTATSSGSACVIATHAVRL
jgi:hypothetical protein